MLELKCVDDTDSRCRCLHARRNDSAWETFILKHSWSLYPDCFASRADIRLFGGTAVAAGLWARFCHCGRAGDGGVQSDGYINGPAAVYCGNTEGYLCGPQQHDSTRQRRTRYAHTETEQTHIIHGSGSQVPVLVRNSTDIHVIQCFHFLF